jgi:hypothetical protein
MLVDMMARIPAYNTYLQKRGMIRLRLAVSECGDARLERGPVRSSKRSGGRRMKDDMSIWRRIESKKRERDAFPV